MPHWRTMIEKDHLAAWDLVVPGTMTPRDYTLEFFSGRPYPIYCAGQRGQSCEPRA